MKAIHRHPLLYLIGLGLAAGACAAPEDRAPEPGRTVAPLAAIAFVGRDQISESELRKAAVDDLIVLAREGKTYQADDAAFTMEEYYKDNGFYAATVDYEMIEKPVPGVLFKVKEGPRAVITSLSLPGRGDVPRRKLTAFFEGPSSRWIGGKTLFVRSQVENAADLIRAWYRSEGYLKAEVAPPIVVFSEDGREANVEVVIAPGIRYTLKSMAFEGIPSFPERLCRQDLADALARPFNTAWPQRAEKRVVALFRSLGFNRPSVDTETKRNDNNGEVTVLFKIDPGKERTVGQILFLGQERTRESLLRSYLAFHEGETFDGSLVNESLESLYGSGLFGRVQVEEVERGESLLDVVFHLKERDARDLAFLAGYGSYELGRGGVTYTDRNLFGRGLSWTSSVKASFRGHRGSTSLTDPLFLDLPLRGTLEFSAQRRTFPSFRERNYGAVASITRPLLENLRASLGYSYEKSTVTALDPGFSILDVEERVTVGSLFTTWIYDDRNSSIFPKSGWDNELKVDLARRYLGSDIDFHRFTGRIAYFLPLEEEDRWVLALGARAGLIVRDAENQAVPAQLRFFNGGEDSVRSFKQDDLGPKADGDALGGEYFSTGNVELRFPIYQRIGGAVFADAGNVRLRRADIGFHDYRYALGVGLRYDLPIGPVRIDWGWNPNRRSDEALWALHLSVGFAF